MEPFIFCALILCISICALFLPSASIRINERISNKLAIGSCNAIDILRYNDIFQRFTDLQSLASKGRLNGQNPDSVAIKNYEDFIEETMVSDFRFEFYYTDRNSASTPVGPIVYSSRDAYLYGDRNLNLLSWIASTDLHSGTINVNGGQFGHVNCDATNTSTLFSRTVDFLTGGRGESLGNLDENENGRIDNKLGLVRFETTFNGYKIAAIKVKSELYGTIEVNSRSFQDPAFPGSASQQTVLKPPTTARLTAKDRFEIQDILTNLFNMQDQAVLDNLNGDVDAIDEYVSRYVANALHDDFVLIVNGVAQNKEETLNGFAEDIKTYTVSHHMVQPVGFLSYQVSYEKDSEGIQHVMEDVVVSYSSRNYRNYNFNDDPPILIMRTGQRKFRREDGAQFMNMGGYVTVSFYQTNIMKKTAQQNILVLGYRFGLLIVINIICICLVTYWFNKRTAKSLSKYKVVHVLESDDENL